MTTIAILPSSDSTGRKQRFEAVTGDHHASGASVGMAIDALNDKLGTTSGPSLIVVQQMQGDEFFDDGQIASVGRLMDEWRRARDLGSPLDAQAECKLSDLVEAELAATIERCKAVTDGK